MEQKQISTRTLGMPIRRRIIRRAPLLTTRQLTEYRPHNERMQSYEVQASDWALPSTGENLRILPQKWCCKETRAIMTKLGRLFIKCRSLMELLRVLHRNMGIPLTNSFYIDARNDDRKMYGSLPIPGNSTTIASAINGLSAVISETRDEIATMKNDANSIGGDVGMTLIDALSALGGSFEPQVDNTTKRSEGPPTLERQFITILPDIITEQQEKEEHMDAISS